MRSTTCDLVLGTAGHIDHGKTALVRLLTGVDTDRLPAEKQRGITIDLGFASLELGPYRLALVDVPGHERFIRNMLAGASGLDLAMLVIAADDSVMPQTREHLEILQLLGLSGGLIVLSKCDLVDQTWASLVEEEIHELIQGTFLENAPIIRTSAVSGKGLEELRQALLEICRSVAVRDDPGLFRMAIDRTFTVAGHGTVVTGTVMSGSVCVGDEVEWHPAGKLLKVRGLHRHNQEVKQIGRGARAAINLTGVHRNEISRGDELAVPGYVTPSRVLSVELEASPQVRRSIQHRGRYRVHLGTAEVPGTVALFEGNSLAPVGKQLGQVFLAHPVVAVYGQPLILRQESPPMTLAGGRILQPVARRIRRRDQPAIQRVDQLRSSDPMERLTAALAVLGLAPWTENQLCARTGLSADCIRQSMNYLTDMGTLVEVPLGPKRSVSLLADVITDLEERIVRALGRLHAARPRLSAIPYAHLAAELPEVCNDTLITHLIQRLRSKGNVTGGVRTVALQGYEPKLSQAERRLKEDLLRAIQEGGMSPPDLTQLAASAGARVPAVPELLGLLCDEQKLVEITPGLYLDFDLEAELRQRVAKHLASSVTMTMAELRDLLGTTRKYAVPIGEYLDRIGLTKRLGDMRQLGDINSSA